MALLVKKQISILDKNLKVAWRELFKSLAKTAAHAVTAKYTELATDVVELGAAVGLVEDPGDIAWLLIRRALTRAFASLLDEHRDLFAVDPPADAKLAEAEAGLNLDDEVLEIDEAFFRNPGSLDLLDRLKPPFVGWLLAYGVKPNAAETIAERLRPYFVLALHDEWARAPSDYARLRDSIHTPFTQAESVERAWLRYQAHLWRVVNEPMFAEAFGLAKVFVAPRAYWEDRKAETYRRGEMGCDSRSDGDGCKVVRNVVMLAEELDRWLAENPKDDAIRILSGGPGCGKSSFARMYAAETAARGQVRVLYLPLHLFDPKGDLVSAVGEYVRTCRVLPSNPLDLPPGDEPKRLLLIFDGLDELAMQGKQATDTSREFVTEVERTLQRLNLYKPWLSALISGRELVVQANATQFRRPREILHMLAYASPESGDHDDEESHRHSGSGETVWEDPGKFMQTDQRTLWWEKYRSASGIDTETIPREFLQGELGGITRQPLLLYLVALSFERGRLHLGPETNLNDVYADLINAVWERGWERRPSPGAKPFTRAQFVRILEEIGLAAWQNERRTTTIKAIRERFKAAGLAHILESFEEGAEMGVTRLLAAFYFRQYGEHDGDKTFEFTHKSFGEYLAACRIVRTLDLVDRDMRDHEEEADRGKDVIAALVTWVEICGPAPLDQYYLRFLNREIARFGADKAIAWQDRLARMMTAAVTSGTPVERSNPRPSTFHEELRQARNADEALFASAAACSDVTKQLTKVNWPSPTAAGEWIRRLQQQRRGPANHVIQGSLRRLDLSQCVLHGADFYRADLRGSSLERAEMLFAWLTVSQLRGAGLRGANLQGASLWGANLRGANLQDANLQHANLQHADLKGANLQGANLWGANLQDTNLRGASLRDANLQDANLQRASLKDANLEGADRTGAILQYVPAEPKESA